MSNILNAQQRRIAYVAYVVIGVIIGTAQVVTSTAYAGQEFIWLDTALAVYAYLGVALGVTAATNIATEGDQPNVADGTALPASDDPTV